MTNQEKNIFILEKVYGWAESTACGDNRRYWTLNNDRKVCYVLDNEFYPSSHDYNHKVPDYTEDPSKVGQLLALFDTNHSSFYLGYNFMFNDYTLSFAQHRISGRSLPEVVTNAVIYLYGGNPNG